MSESPAAALLFERLKANWLAEGMKPASGTCAEVIAGFEARYSLTLAIEVAEYFRTMNGSQGDWDADLWDYWPLERVQAASEYGLPDLREAPGRCFVFADYSIDAAFLGVWLPADPSAPAAVLTYWSAWVVVAPSFTAFWEAYLAGNRDILSGKPLPG